MRKLSTLLMLLALQIALAGCTRAPVNQPPARTASNVDPIEQDERAIELNAERAKQNIDAIKAEAEDALRRTHQNLTAKAKQPVSQVSDAAEELAEDAKDRAEDVPEAVDQALDERQSDLRSRIRKRLEAEREAIEQEASDSSR